jgi:hypothetical protein
VDGDLKCVQAGIGCGSGVGVYSLEVKADDNWNMNICNKKYVNILLVTELSALKKKMLS